MRRDLCGHAPWWTVLHSQARGVGEREREREGVKERKRKEKEKTHKSLCFPFLSLSPSLFFLFSLFLSLARFLSAPAPLACRSLPSLRPPPRLPRTHCTSGEARKAAAASLSSPKPDMLLPRTPLNKAQSSPRRRGEGDGGRKRRERGRERGGREKGEAEEQNNGQVATTTSHLLSPLPCTVSLRCLFSPLPRTCRYCMMMDS